MGKPASTESAYDLLENVESRAAPCAGGPLEGDRKVLGPRGRGVGPPGIADGSDCARYRKVPIELIESRYASESIEKRRSLGPALWGSLADSPSPLKPSSVV